MKQQMIGPSNKQWIEETDAKTKLAAVVAFLLYVGVIVGANWMIAHVGKVIPGAHVLPVGFGLYAPSGVYLAAFAFVARDILQRLTNIKVGLAAILIGAIVSAFVSTPSLAFASGVTFMISESLDFLIYTPLQARNFPLAVVVSGLASDVVDSVVFLTLAHIPLALALKGQLVGKMWVILLGGVLAGLMRKLPIFAGDSKRNSATS
ncbi:MAG: VUT family protein [Acidimicrobiaceae bacterium]|nr:VUT family protein [Acidimicrobiaceae bacterium]